MVAALWFCFCVAQQRAGKQRKLAKDPPGTLTLPLTPTPNPDPDPDPEPNPYP